jgi:hypothetical protein
MLFRFGPIVLVVALITVACAKTELPTSPTDTGAPPPSANQPPVINSIAVSPSWGISTLQEYSFTSSASDPDGDQLTYSWDVGTTHSSDFASFRHTAMNAETATSQATLTVTDTGGLSSTSTVAFRSVSVTGNWSGTLGSTPMTATLTQYLGGLVQGTWQLVGHEDNGQFGPSGAPGTIRADGTFTFRAKVLVGAYTDFYWNGTIDPTGQTMTGALTDCCSSNPFMTLHKQ